MAMRPILIHPDPRLKQDCALVEGVDDALRKLVDDMFETMYAAPGIGLAAPQVGVLRRVFVMDCAARDAEERASDEEGPEAGAAARQSAGAEPRAFVNPEIIWSSDETRLYNEGCLSIPEQYDDVRRPASVRVRWEDLSGQTHEELFDGLAATCVQHEIDHLHGRLFIDHIGPVRRAMITQRMKKLKRERAKERARASDRARR